ATDTTNTDTHRMGARGVADRVAVHVTGFIRHGCVLDLGGTASTRLVGWKLPAGMSTPRAEHVKTVRSVQEIRPHRPSRAVPFVQWWRAQCRRMLRCRPTKPESAMRRSTVVSRLHPIAPAVRAVALAACALAALWA